MAPSVLSPRSLGCNETQKCKKNIYLLLGMHCSYPAVDSQYRILILLLQEFCGFLRPASEADFFLGFLRIFINIDH